MPYKGNSKNWHRKNEKKEEWKKKKIQKKFTK